jgi:hypothetical protein
MLICGKTCLVTFEARLPRQISERSKGEGTLVLVVGKTLE